MGLFRIAVTPAFTTHSEAVLLEVSDKRLAALYGHFRQGQTLPALCQATHPLSARHHGRHTAPRVPSVFAVQALVVHPASQDTKTTNSRHAPSQLSQHPCQALTTSSLCLPVSSLTASMLTHEPAAFPCSPGLDLVTLPTSLSFAHRVPVEYSGSDW